MKNIKILANFIKQDFFKSLIIMILIFFSVFACTFFLIPLVKQGQVNKSISSMRIDMEHMAFFSESSYIPLYEANYEQSKHKELKKSLTNIEGVESVNSTYQIITKSKDFSTILYDIPLIEIVNNKVEDGKWIDTKEINENSIPIIVSYELKNKYPINSKFEIEAQGANFFNDENDIVKINCNVVGILPKDSYQYIGGSSHSDTGISDAFQKITKNNPTIIIPNIFEENIRYIANSGAIIKYKDVRLQCIEDEVKKSGIGKVYSIDELKNNDFSNIFYFNEQQIYEFLVIICFIIASIGGYNTLSTLNYRRLLTIYYINGLTINKSIMFIVIKNILLITIPTLVSSIISNKIILSIKSLYAFDIKVVLWTLLIYIIPIIVTILTTINSIKKIKPIEVLKEV